MPAGGVVGGREGCAVAAAKCAAGSESKCDCKGESKRESTAASGAEWKSGKPDKEAAKTSSSAKPAVN